MLGKRALRRLLLALLGLQLLALPLAQAMAGKEAGIDPHQLFEERCTRCHGHAADFARGHLQLVGTTVAGTKVRGDFSAFLKRHQGGVSASQAAVLIDAFRRQLLGGGLFQERCSVCHQRAYELARLHLILVDGNLMGRYSGRDMAEFLPIHGVRTADEAEQLFEMLLWHRQTIEAASHGG